MDPALFQEKVTSEIQHGVVYPDGRVDWNVHTWFGTIDTPARRKAFVEQYALQQLGLGIQDATVTFLVRTTITVMMAAEVLVDKEEEVPPTPVYNGDAEPEEYKPISVGGAPAAPEEDAEEEEYKPVNVGDSPAAPDEDAEPPAGEAPVEEESPVEQDGTDSTEPVPSPADNKGVIEDGG